MENKAVYIIIIIIVIAYYITSWTTQYKVKDKSGNYWRKKHVNGEK
jgi:hypothetical protein